MKEESDATNRFIVKNEFVITTDTAKMFNDKTGKVYFITKDGLYIHVINPGNGNKAEYNQEVVVRFQDMIYFKTDTTKISNVGSTQYPITFSYGNTYTYGADYYGLSCAGLAIGLSLVSENAEVSLIVPSALQSYTQQSYFEPLYFGYLIYRFR